MDRRRFSAATRAAHLLRSLWRFIQASVWRFLDDHCFLHASGLAYTSLLSLVPLLAIMFAVLKGLGVQQRLEPLLLNQLALNEEVTRRIMSYIDRTNVGTLGALGAIGLVFTVVSVLGNIEATFNHIWRVRRGRSYLRKATDYISTVLLIPFLLLATVTITSAMQEQALMRRLLHETPLAVLSERASHLVPIVLNTLGLAFLYSVFPNRRPHVPSIFLGASLAGSAWHLVQVTYVKLQIGVARYNAIYGALAQLPVLLVWLYLSWVVVLAGAEIAAAYENGADDERGPGALAQARAVALELLFRAFDRFVGSGPAVEVARVARELAVSRTLVEDVAESLRGRGFLILEDEGEGRYALGRDPDQIHLADVDQTVAPIVAPRRCDPRVRLWLDRLGRETHEVIGRYTLRAAAASDGQARGGEPRLVSAGQQ